MRGLRVSWSSSAWMVARSLCVMCVCDGMKALVALARTGDASRSRNVLLFWFTCSAGLCDRAVNATRRRVLLPCRRSLQLLPTLGNAAQNDVGMSTDISQAQDSTIHRVAISPCHDQTPSYCNAVGIPCFVETMEYIAHSAAKAGRQRLCASCLKSWRRSRASTKAGRMGLQNSNRIQRRFKGYIAPEGEQARPITGFYAGWTFDHVACDTCTNNL